MMYTKRLFRFTTLRFIQPYSEVLGDIEGSIWLIPGSYKSNNSFNFTSIDKFHLNCDCLNGSFVNGFREPIWYNFALLKLPGHKICLAAKSKLINEISESVLTHVTFYLANNEHKALVFNGGTIGFICQLFKL